MKRPALENITRILPLWNKYSGDASHRIVLIESTLYCLRRVFQIVAL
jgi:hypothetical protein